MDQQEGNPCRAPKGKLSMVKILVIITIEIETSARGSERGTELIGRNRVLVMMIMTSLCQISTVLELGLIVQVHSKLKLSFWALLTGKCTCTRQTVSRLLLLQKSYQLRIWSTWKRSQKHLWTSINK